MNYDRFTDKDLLNSQNYVSSKQINAYLFFEKNHLAQKLWIFSFTKIFFRKILTCINNKNKDIILFILNIIIMFIWISVFYLLSDILATQLSIVIYILIYIHNSSLINSIINTYIKSNYIILWFRSDEALLKYYSIDDIESISSYSTKVISKDIWEKKYFQELNLKHVLKFWIIVHIPIIIYFLEKYFYTFL